jgi:Tfp pilus assembly protein PilV
MRTVRSCRAFSIIEILVALAFLSFGIYAVQDLLGSSHRTANLADEKIRLSALGRQKLVELEAAGPNLAAFLEKAQPGQEISYPAEGARAFDRQPDYQWRASFKREGATATIRVIVSKVGLVGSSGQTTGQVRIGKEAAQ